MHDLSDPPGRASLSSACLSPPCPASSLSLGLGIPDLSPGPRRDTAGASAIKAAAARAGQERRRRHGALGQGDVVVITVTCVVTDAAAVVPGRPFAPVGIGRRT